MGFFMSPLYHIVQLAKLSRQLTSGPSDLFHSTRQSCKAVLAVLGLCLFFCPLILPGRRRTLNLQTLSSGRCPWCVSRYALRCESTTVGPRESCMPCKARLHGSASPLVSAVSLASSSRPLATWSPLAITLGLSCCSCSSSD